MLPPPRHPFLHETESRSVEVVANDVVATCESSFHVLTGANMSGKSTYLKMVILLQVTIAKWALTFRYELHFGELGA